MASRTAKDWQQHQRTACLHLNDLLQIKFKQDQDTRVKKSLPSDGSAKTKKLLHESRKLTVTDVSAGEYLGPVRAPAAAADARYRVAAVFTHLHFLFAFHFLLPY